MFIKYVLKDGVEGCKLIKLYVVICYVIVIIKKCSFFIWKWNYKFKIEVNKVFFVIFYRFFFVWFGINGKFYLGNKIVFFKYSVLIRYICLICICKWIFWGIIIEYI